MLAIEEKKKSMSCGIVLLLIFTLILIIGVVFLLFLSLGYLGDLHLNGQPIHQDHPIISENQNVSSIPSSDLFITQTPNQKHSQDKPKYLRKPNHSQVKPKYLKKSQDKLLRIKSRFNTKIGRKKHIQSVFWQRVMNNGKIQKEHATYNDRINPICDAVQYIKHSKGNAKEVMKWLNNYVTYIELRNKASGTPINEFDTWYQICSKS